MTSKRHVRRHQCGDKVRHATEAAAKTALNVLWRKKMYRGRAYHCKWCGKWHVGRKG